MTMATASPLCYYTIMKKRKKKDNSKPSDYFVNCRCCGEYIRPDWRSAFDKRYCMDCL